jgi:hypothetical protein
MDRGPLNARLDKNITMGNLMDAAMYTISAISAKP